MSWVIERYRIARLSRDRITELAKCLSEHTGMVEDRFFRLPCLSALMHYAKARCISHERANEFKSAVVRLCNFEPETVNCWEVVPCG